MKPISFLKFSWIEAQRLEVLQLKLGKLNELETHLAALETRKQNVTRKGPFLLSLHKSSICDLQLREHQKPAPLGTDVTALQGGDHS